MKKRTKATVIVALFASVCIIATTLALYAGQTESKLNTFTKSAGVSISLREPAWDGYNFNDNVDNVKLGTQKNPAKANEFLGIDAAKAYMPADIVKKDPTIRVDADSEAAWVAIKVEFFNQNKEVISQETFENTYGKIVIDSKFELIERKGTHSVYMYKTSLSQTEATVPLFKEVKINEDIALVDGVLPSFKIQTTGYAVQAKGIDANTASTELIKMI